MIQDYLLVDIESQKPCMFINCAVRSLISHSFALLAPTSRRHRNAEDYAMDLHSRRNMKCWTVETCRNERTCSDRRIALFHWDNPLHHTETMPNHNTIVHIASQIEWPVQILHRHPLAFIWSSTDRLRTRKHLSSVYDWKWNASSNPDKIQTGSTHTITIALFQWDLSCFMLRCQPTFR